MKVKNKSIGRRIKKIRKGLDKLQRQLAAEVGVSHQTIGKWERDEVKPNSENLPPLSRALGKSISYILEGE
jgi:transcriptional regulator with XRE-family HTH domain